MIKHKAARTTKTISPKITKNPAPASQKLERFAIGNRVYELIDILEGNENRISGYEMIKRAKKFHANLGKEEGQFILGCQDEIPEIFWDLSLYFPQWHPSSIPELITYLKRIAHRWLKNSAYPGNSCYRYDRLVRRVK